ncbi:hypothetical protein BDN72DRAFT_450970 [Pluteus cervinus]|uniref:Uncharacterized protein n=1 Tax=Pluteus cervinus TaxID=181527 RepID=A0ACD3BDH6_9AGAR|nr:hypothetical protein BDN72DRAFT_450970 [Pluteus cervinus]
MLRFSIAALLLLLGTGALASYGESDCRDPDGCSPYKSYVGFKGHKRDQDHYDDVRIGRDNYYGRDDRKDYGQKRYNGEYDDKNKYYKDRDYKNREHRDRDYRRGDDRRHLHRHEHRHDGYGRDHGYYRRDLEKEDDSHSPEYKPEYKTDDYKPDYKVDNKGEYKQDDKKVDYAYKPEYRPEEKEDTHAKAHGEEAKSSHRKEAYLNEADDDSYKKIDLDIDESKFKGYHGGEKY